MKKISDDLFCHVEKESKKIRMWHTCEKYKGGKRGAMRVELQKKGDVFKCPHCDFKYTLNKAEIQAAYSVPTIRL